MLNLKFFQGSEYVRPPDLPLTDMLIPPEEDPELIRQAARFAHLQDFRDLTREWEWPCAYFSPWDTSLSKKMSSFG